MTKHTEQISVGIVALTIDQHVKLLTGLFWCVLLLVKVHDAAKTFVPVQDEYSVPETGNYINCFHDAMKFILERNG